MQEFKFIDTYGKFEHSCSLQLVDYQLIVTPKSVTLTCRYCGKSNFYRVIGEYQKL